MQARSRRLDLFRRFIDLAADERLKSVGVFLRAARANVLCDYAHARVHSCIIHAAADPAV